MSKPSTGRLLWRDLLLIAIWSLAFQAFWMLRLEHPSYFDAYYYTTNARRLAAGQGFSEEIIWQYLDDPAGLPHPSHTYWMPLPSLVGAAGYALGGTFRWAQLPFWLLAGLLPWLAYAISWRLSHERWQARAAALFTAAGGYYAAYWLQPTTFVLFAWVGGGGLLALAYAQEKRRLVYWALAGLLAGMAHLTRADGVLLLPVAALTWFLWYREQRPGRRRAPAALGLLLAGYLLVMLPWFWHTFTVTGRPLSTVGTQTIFITDYNHLFSYGRHFDLAGYLAWGWENIVRSKLAAAWLAIQTFIAVTGLTAFTIFLLIGWATRRRLPALRRFLRPATWYTLLLFISMSLVFTFPGQRGSLLHSSTALWPWSMALVPAGVAASIGWIAARRPVWRPQQARRLFTVVFILMVYLVTLVVSAAQPLRRDEAAIYRELGSILPPGVVVMTGDPPGFYYHTSLPAIAIPAEPLTVTLAVAQRYHAQYLLLDPDRPPELADLHAGAITHPRVELVADLGNGFRLYRLAHRP